MRSLAVVRASHLLVFRDIVAVKPQFLPHPEADPVIIGPSKINN